jgi:hypothetical protein
VIQAAADGWKRLLSRIFFLKDPCVVAVFTASVLLLCSSFIVVDGVPGEEAAETSRLKNNWTMKNRTYTTSKGKWRRYRKIFLLIGGMTGKCTSIFRSPKKIADGRWPIADGRYRLLSYICN